MANLFRSLISRRQTDEVTRFSTQDYLRWLSTAWNGLVQPMYPSTSTYSRGKPAERIENSFTGYVYGAYKVNPIVYGLMTRRSSVFSEARFMWREVLDGKPGDLFWNPALQVLSKPWPNGTTGELLTRMIQDVDLAGNSYIVNEGDRLRRLRPDWVQIILSGNPLTDPDVDVVGYTFTPGGPDAGEPVAYMPDEVCHWSPIPDPDAQYRGMSWLTPVVREIQGDQAATSHKLAFYRNGATLGPIVKLPKEMTPEQFKKFIQADREAHAGAENAYATMYIGGGADVTLAAANMQQLDFKAVQGAGETRLCVASGVPAVIAGVSEGLSGSSLNAGNYGTAKRSFADGTLRTLWRSACAALSTILEVPDDAELWYDESHIAFLREDQQDQAQIDQTTMATIVSGITGGFEPATVVATVRPQWSKTLKHSGLMSVQLTPPGSEPTDTIAGGDVPPPDDGIPPDQARSQSDLDDELDEVLWALDEVIERSYNPDQARISAGHVGGGRFGSKITPLLQHWLAAGGKGDPLGEAGVSRQTIVAAAKAHGVEVPPRMPLAALKAALYAAVHERAVAHTGGTLHPEVTEHQHRVRRIEAAKGLAELARDIDSASTLSETPDPGQPSRSDVIREHIDGAEQAGELTPDQAAKLRGMLHGDGPEVRQVEVDNRIRAAYAAVLARRDRTARPGDTQWVGLVDLRAELGDMPRGEVDAGLRRLEQTDGVNVVPESNQKTLSAADRAAAVVIGDQPKHAISIDDPSPRPVPVSPTGASKVKAAVTRMNTANGVSLIGNADKTTTFDPALHKPLVHDTAADSIAPGTWVRVVQQGHALDGTTVEKAVVAPVGRASAKKATRTASPPTSAGSVPDGRPEAGFATGRAALTAGQLDLSELRPPGVSSAEWDAVDRYLSDGKRINELLREGRTGSATIRHLDRLLERSTTDRGMEVWRGLQSGDAIFGDAAKGSLVGFEWDDSAYLSTSANRSIAEQFAGSFGDPEPMLLRIAAPKGTHALTLLGWGNGMVLGGQAEILLPRGAHLRVVADHGVQSHGMIPQGIRVLDVEVAPVGRPTKKAAPAKAAPRSLITTTGNGEAAFSVESMKASLNAVNSKEEGRALLGSLTAAQVRELADALDIPPERGSRSKDSYVNGIVKHYVGGRLLVDIIHQAQTAPSRREVMALGLAEPGAPVGRPAKKAAPAKPTVQTDKGGRVTREEAGRLMHGDKGYEQKVAKKATPITFDPETVTDALAAATSREGGHAALEGLSAAELKQVAQRLSVNPHQPKAQLRHDLVEATVGTRTDAAGIRGGRWATPAAPSLTPRKGASAVRPAEGEAALSSVPVDLSATGAADLPAEVRDALAAYHSHGAVNINDYLRGTGVFTGPMAEHYRPQTEAWIRGLDHVMGTSATGQDIQVWRGLLRPEEVLGDVNSLPKNLTGTTFVDPAFVSTSVTRAASDRFVGADRFQLRIRVPKGTRAVKISGPEHESEILLDRGLTYRVVGDHTEPWPHGDGRVRILDVEAVDQKTPPPPGSAAPSLTLGTAEPPPSPGRHGWGDSPPSTLDGAFGEAVDNQAADPAYMPPPRSDHTGYPHPDTEVRTAIEDAWARVANGAGLASLADVRDQLGPRYPWDQVNRVLRDMTTGPEPDGVLLPETNQQYLTQRQRDARINLGGQSKHVLAFDDAPAARIRARQAGPAVRASTADDLSRGHAHPGQRYKHGWIPIGPESSWASLPDRQQHITETAASPVVGPVEGYGGFMGGTARETHADGTVSIHKQPQTTLGVDGLRQADAEELGSLVANAVGVHAPAIHRAGPTDLHMEFMAGAHIDHSPIAPWARPPQAVVESDQGHLMGLLDLLMGNNDRHAGNWMLQDDGSLVALDHALSLNNKHASSGLGAFSAPFVNAAGNDWAPTHDMSPEDMALIHQRLDTLRPEFERLHRLDWWQSMMENLAIFEPRATGTRSRIG